MISLKKEESRNRLSWENAEFISIPTILIVNVTSINISNFVPDPWKWLHWKPRFPHLSSLTIHHETVSTVIVSTKLTHRPRFHLLYRVSTIHHPKPGVETKGREGNVSFLSTAFLHPFRAFHSIPSRKPIPYAFHIFVLPAIFTVPTPFSATRVRLAEEECSPTTFRSTLYAKLFAAFCLGSNVLLHRLLFGYNFCSCARI